MSAYFKDSGRLACLEPVFEQSKVCLTVADDLQRDCPLVGVNDAFCELSGYAPDEMLGRNCRFLQPKTGAGTVRDRMRRFLNDPAQKDAKFVIPNERKDGTRFLNLVYMAKLRHARQIVGVLGSQFAIGGAVPDVSIYDRAISEDLRTIKDMIGENHLALLGSYDALASGLSIVAQAKLD